MVTTDKLGEHGGRSLGHATEDPFLEGFNEE